MTSAKILFFVTVLTILFISCDKENLHAGIFHEFTYISVYIEEAVTIFTKGTATNEKEIRTGEEERKIRDLSFFIFDADGVRETSYGYHTFRYTGNQYTFPIPTGKNKTILAVTNLQYVGDLEEANLKTVRQILQSRMDNPPADRSVSNVVMTGEHTGIHATQQQIQVIKIQLFPTEETGCPEEGFII